MKKTNPTALQTLVTTYYVTNTRKRKRTIYLIGSGSREEKKPTPYKLHSMLTM